ncbi:hypothetical protein V1477_001664 [Vespula maculifrons]|uniref:Secreted protein n=1 Tax=Vespula maculifrons TaxID=7453 RepID=A0ABD2D194_VESMC
MFRCPEIVEPVTMVTLVVVMVAAVARSISHIALWILHNALTRTTASLRDVCFPQCFPCDQTGMRVVGCKA